MNRRLPGPGLALALASLLPLYAPAHAHAAAPDVGKAYRVPFRLTDTNHFLVRVRVNGKGPFNFLVDTGAPALYVATETARKVGLKPDPDVFWTPVDRLEFEGGARLTGLKARVEDPFQLVGMNALGLPGASIDGILGYTVLARFRIELDPTKDRMTWTRLDFDPRDPPTPRRRAGDKPPADMQAMNALGPLSKVAAALIGKQPEESRVPRGSLGVELSADAQGEKGQGVRVARVLERSPAAEAGVLAGDRIVRVGDREVGTPEAARAAVAAVKPGDRVRLTVRRQGGPNEGLTLTVNAGEGL
ncbi:MAG: PDZ domain-containing protein [Isosphaeraceae bacterium]